MCQPASRLQAARGRLGAAQQAGHPSGQHVRGLAVPTACSAAAPAQLKRGRQGEPPAAAAAPTEPRPHQLQRGAPLQPGASPLLLHAHLQPHQAVVSDAAASGAGAASAAAQPAQPGCGGCHTRLGRQQPAHEPPRGLPRSAAPSTAAAATVPCAAGRRTGWSALQLPGVAAQPPAPRIGGLPRRLRCSARPPPPQCRCLLESCLRLVGPVAGGPAVPAAAAALPSPVAPMAGAPAERADCHQGWPGLWEGIKGIRVATALPCIAKLSL